MYQRKALSLEEARKAMEAMLEVAAKDFPTFRGAYAIVDERGELICFAKQDNAAPWRTEMAIKKAYSSAQWANSTYDIRMKAFKPEGLDITKFNLGTKYTPIAGGVPITKPGDDVKDIWQYREVVGAIGTSVGPELEDERLGLVGVKVIQDILWPAK